MFRRVPRPSENNSEKNIFVTNQFDKRFKTIIERELDITYFYILEWLNENSINDVQVKAFHVQKIDNKWVIFPSGRQRLFIGFENKDDALYFKLKFGAGEIIE